jgi:hypothetical protein
LVGGPENLWVQRETDNLRFRFADWKDPRTVRIEDIEHPQSKEWSLSPDKNSEPTQNFALIARFYEPDLRENVVVAGGIGKYGTTFAGEILTEPAFLDNLARELPKDWQTKNIEMVIATRMVRAQPGPLRVVATNTW